MSSSQTSSGPHEPSITETLEHAAARLSELQGVPFRDLHVAFGLPDEAGVNSKGLGRRVLEHALGWANDSRPAEAGRIKSIPIQESGAPRESTRLCGLNYSRTVVTPFESSDVYRLLGGILFAPIVKRQTHDPSLWCFAAPFVWLASPDELATFRSDYEAIRHYIVLGRADELSSSRSTGQGQMLVARTAGRDSADRVTYEYPDGTDTARRRAFYLRTDFTRRVLSAHLPTPRRPLRGLEELISLLGER